MNEKFIPENVTDKLEAFQRTADFITAKHFKVIKIDITRPWGFFFYIDTSQIDQFINEFYEGVDLPGIDTKLPLQPKILAIEPGKKLSWQYHHRRAEIWRCINDEFQVITSDDDTEKDNQTLKTGDVVSLSQGQRHRAVGGKNWSSFAEIWQHTDPAMPSDEDDIVRIQDDFGR